MAAHPRASTATSAAVATLGATLLVVLLAVWAASIGPDEVFRGEGSRATVESPSLPPSDTPSGSTPADRDSPDRSGGPSETPLWMRVLALLVRLGAAAAVLYALFRAGRWVVDRWQQRGSPSAGSEADFEVLDAPAPAAVARSVVDDAADQRLLLQEGTPRNAIVACWHRFELQADAVGLAREPWETSSEFTLRLLDLISADPGAVAELARLYREARFSDHELGQDARDRALAALDVIHAGLDARFGGRR